MLEKRRKKHGISVGFLTSEDLAPGSGIDLELEPWPMPVELGLPGFPKA